MASTTGNNKNAMKHQQNTSLYKALTTSNEQQVINLCQELEEGPFHVVTPHNDTVLHIAAYSQQNDLVLDLLKMVNDLNSNKLRIVNGEGNTILHEAATTDELVPAATEIMRRSPQTQRMRNRHGEVPMFRAAHYGKNTMFRFLDEELRKYVSSEETIKELQRRYDKGTILHLSVATDNFLLAYRIATKYEYLVWERDGDGMTPLQPLACKPSAFNKTSKYGPIKDFIWYCFSSEVISKEEGSIEEEDDELHCRTPLWEIILKEKQEYKATLKLAKYLIERDTSWESTEARENRVEAIMHKFQKDIQKVQEKKSEKEGNEGKVRVPDTPLILATKNGSVDIVKEILGRYPQAIEHVDYEGRNVVHVALKFRQIEIFEIIEQMKIPMRRLVRKIDDEGNSILHMVGMKPEAQVKDLRNPTIQLQDNLLLFERVKNICEADYVNLINGEKKTARALLEGSNKDLHTEAKEWLKRTSENCTIVAVLIATVAFAAAYTVPGGSNDQTGYPILRDQPFFIIFTIADVLSITFALTSVVTFLSILTSPFQLSNFIRSLPQKLMLGVTLLILSISMMMLAFAATIILTEDNKKEWTKIALYAMAFLPVSIFAASYLPLYAALWHNLKESQKVLWQAFRRCTRNRHHSSSAARADSSIKFTERDHIA